MVPTPRNATLLTWEGTDALPSVDRLTEARGIKQLMREYGWRPADGDLGRWRQSLDLAQAHVHVPAESTGNTVQRSHRGVQCELRAC